MLRNFARQQFFLGSSAFKRPLNVGAAGTVATAGTAAGAGPLSILSSRSLPLTHSFFVANQQQQFRFASSSSSTVVPVTELKPGNFFKLNNEFCVVDSVKRIAYARLSAYVKLDYYNYREPGNILKQRYGVGDSVERIDPERIDAIFSYIDEEKKVMVLNDEEYNEIEVPLSLFPLGIQEALVAGDNLTVYKYENTWISASFSSTTQSKLRKVQRAAA